MSTVNLNLSASWEPLSYNPKVPLLKRAVSWYHLESQKHPKLAAIAMIAAAIFLALAVVTIPLIIQFTARLKHVREVEAFYKEAGTKSPPPINRHIDFETKTETFNHVSSYVIHEGIIWHKQKLDGYGNEIVPGEWKPLYFDGWPERTPVEIKTDGANLIVIDDANGVHYKKVIKERFDAKNHLYRMHDKSDKDNWKEQWFSFPVLNRIVNFFTGKRLYLPKDRKAWAIGHKGQYAHQMEDRVGNKYILGIGVTTLYVLDRSGRFIYLFDPWKPKSVRVKIPVPSTADSPFIAENISVAGSTVMLIGYRYEKQKDGSVLKKPEIHTMLVDIDSLGWTPVVKYSYDKDYKHDKRLVGFIILPVENGWKNIPLPTDGEVHSAITILQTGQGNASREMRVYGKKDEKPGYWSRGMGADSWTFHEKMGLAPVGSQEMKTAPADTLPDPSVFHWESKEGIRITDFHAGCILGTVKAGNVDLLLHRRDNLIAQVFTNNTSTYRYDLVLPDNAKAEDLPKSLRSYFKNRRVVPLRIKPEGERLRLKERGLRLSKLNIHFTKSKENHE